MKETGLDSKHSWVVAAASCVIFTFVTSPMRLGSQLFVSILDSYGADRNSASFPFALAYCARSLSGPFAGYFGEKLGLQRVTQIGCLLCAVGIGGCFFADSIFIIDICFGVIFGFGLGWSTAVVPEIITRNFDKHRAKGQGIVFGGSGLGAAFCAPLLELILFHLGTSGTFLILSAVILNSIPATLMLTEPKPILKKEETKLYKLYSENVSESYAKKSNPFCVIEFERKSNLKEKLNLHRNELVANAPTSNEKLNSQHRNELVANAPPSNEKLNSHRNELVANASSSNEKLNSHRNEFVADAPTCKSSEILNLRRNSSSAPNSSSDISCSLRSLVNVNNKFFGSQPCFKNIQEQQTSSHGQNIRDEIPALSIQFPSMLTVQELNDKNKVPPIISTRIKTPDILSTHTLKDQIHSISNTLNSENIKSIIRSSNSSVSVLWSPVFLLITLIQSFHFYVIYMFLTITIDIIRDKGIERDHEVYFVMAMSFSDTVGRLFLASITDHGYITIANFSAVCFALMGLLCLMIVFVSGFWATLAAICLLGLVLGGNTTSLPGTLNEFIEKKNRAMAMASRLLLFAPISFTMAPLIGVFREGMGSYDGLLYILLAMTFMCSIILQFMSRFIRRKGREEKCEQN